MLVVAGADRSHIAQEAPHPGERLLAVEHDAAGAPELGLGGQHEAPPAGPARHRDAVRVRVGAPVVAHLMPVRREPEHFEQGLVRAQALLDEEKSLKKANKEARAALEETTKEVIEGLTDAQRDDLLAAKWIEPLQAELLALPKAVVSDFIAKVAAINAKYATTYSDVCNR